MSQAEVLISPLDVAAPSIDGVRAPLSEFAVGDHGVIASVGDDSHAALVDGELERRLLELGFVEGARVELIHQGLIGRDPIAVRVDDMRIALRRREAASVFVTRTGRRT